MCPPYGIHHLIHMQSMATKAEGHGVTVTELQRQSSRVRAPGSELQGQSSRVRAPGSELQGQSSRVRVCVCACVCA
ncbi:hypothetical protein EYF80_057012 [Liparis tanakae]|uniref:Uncharacterized protein n=1 Tax=Liparis tanakae TaxID=230148 RepID=A0A4Z2EWU0_9TELE|nr:hypothetical protein EYF80_057012 [Liparis tanakae]